MILSTIQSDIIASLKKGDTVRAQTMRFLLSAVRNSAIEKYGKDADTKVTDADVLDVVKKQVKTHKESIEAFTKAGRTDLSDKEKAELAILEVFLPKELSDEDLKAILAPVIASGEKDFGKLMRDAMGKVAGQADGGRVSALLRTMTSSK